MVPDSSIIVRAGIRPNQLVVAFFFQASQDIEKPHNCKPFALPTPVYRTRVMRFNFHIEWIRIILPNRRRYNHELVGFGWLIPTNSSVANIKVGCKENDLFFW